MEQWTARCKSGYIFGRKPCSRFTGRGVILCADCKSAEVIPDPPSLLSRLLARVNHGIAVPKANIAEPWRIQEWIDIRNGPAEAGFWRDVRYWIDGQP